MQTAQRPDELGGEGAYKFNALNLRVERGGGFEFKVRRGLVALGAEGDELALAARGEEALDGRSFFC